MKRVLRRSGFAIAVSLGILGVGASCTEERTGFFIRGNVVIEGPDCIARPESSAVLHASGVLDVALRTEYEAALLVGSQLAPRGDKANLRTETMITTITGAEVHLYDDAGATVAEFTVPATGVIPPETSADPGFGIAMATLIPAATGRDLRDSPTDGIQLGEVRTRVAEVVVFGKTLGGLEVETAPLTYVIRVCNGCLVDFPSDALDGSGACTLALTDADAPPCRFGQDDPVDCRLCSGTGNPACRPAEAAP